jgi:hypothetical protein
LLERGPQPGLTLLTGMAGSMPGAPARIDQEHLIPGVVQGHAEHGHRDRAVSPARYGAAELRWLGTRRSQPSRQTSPAPVTSPVAATEKARGNEWRDPAKAKTSRHLSYCDAAQAADGSFCDAGLLHVVTDASGTIGLDFALKTAA